RAPRLDVVDVAGPVGGDQERALPAGHEERVAPDARERPHRRVDPAGDAGQGPRPELVAHWSRSATRRAAYVRMKSAPARLIAVRCSSITASPSSQPFAAAASTMAYSPLTWYAPSGTGTVARTRLTTSR